MHTRLTHVRANVRNLQRSIEWYREVLGFELQDTWPLKNPFYADFVCGEGATFAIMQTEPAPSGGRFNFSTGDVESLWEQLKDRAPVAQPLVTTPYGSHRFTILDPDGNELGFIQE